MIDHPRGRLIFGCHSLSRRGFSLLELVVVLTILAATAVLVLPMISTNTMKPGGDIATPHEITTHTTLQEIREAMVGADGVMENLAHHPDALPREVSELVSEQAPQHVRESAPDLTQYNPLFNVGWRGPYLVPTGKNLQGQPTLVDGWGQEILLQIDFDKDGEVDSTESQYVRLVSAGPNGEFETPADETNMMPGTDENRQLTLSECGDDMVMFLCVPDYRQ